MSARKDLGTWIHTDEDAFVVQVVANDPRACPTEVVVVGGPAREVTLADLEALTGRLREDCDWRMGYEESVAKQGGGIGGEGATVLSLTLGVVGAVPSVIMLLERLRRPIPACPDREDALSTATWAIALQYDTVDRRSLAVVREACDSHHWTFSFRLAESHDHFEVEVYGSRAGTVATRVVWTNGDPWGSPPGPQGS